MEIFFKATLLSMSLLIAALCRSGESYAAWSTDPATNNAISTASNDQSYPKIVSDGSGGAIIVWEDKRSGTNTDIYAQRIDVSGNVKWTTNGVAISTAANDQKRLTIVSDGSGGAIIAWEDYRSIYSETDIYAQRIDASGNVKWTANGVAISTAANNQKSPTIVGSATKK